MKIQDSYFRSNSLFEMILDLYYKETMIFKLVSNLQTPIKYI